MSSSTHEPGSANILPPNSDNNGTDSTVGDSVKSPKHATPASARPHFTDTITFKMFNLFKEVIIVVLLAIAYAAVTNNPVKVGKSPAAYPFFQRGSSPVTDWYRGEISKAIEQARLSDMAFVMFYAPWDAQSQAARNEFEVAAEFMNELVTFVAINCWQPGSECKNQYSKVYRWPVLIAYPTHGRGVQYNGPIIASHMIRFLKNVCAPLTSGEDPTQLLGKHDAVVFGFMDALPGSYEYAAYYLTALRYLERDPFRDVHFSVYSQSSYYDKVLTLYLWNETRIYDGEEWNPDALLTWINNNLHQVSAWISPSGTKSLALSNFLDNGPTLILFTPRNPFFNQNDYYNMLREIAYEYYNCDNNELISIHQEIIHFQRTENYVTYQETKRKCTTPTLLSVTHAWNMWSNTSSCSNRQLNPGVCFDECTLAKKTCNDSNLKTSMFTDINSELTKRAGEEKCKYFLNGQKFLPGTFAKINDVNFSITGLFCSTNKSLQFIAMDSLEYYHFAEQLGVDLSKSSHRTAAIIVSEEDETHYLMKGNVDSFNLKFFIHNFTNDLLNRALNNSNSISLKNTHSFPLQKKCKQKFCISELNTENFLSKITQSNKAVILFYYSKQCAFCSGISHIYLTTARMLKYVDNIEFTRINGDLNLLPWEYTMESYPTILLFPAFKKSESRTFPRTIPITVQNLLSFILTNLESNLKLHVLWSICNQTKFDDEKSICIASIRAETLLIVGKLLRQWRNVDVREKSEILYKLQVLRQLHLLFAHSPWRFGLIQNYLKKLNSTVTSKTVAKKRIKDEL